MNISLTPMEHFELIADFVRELYHVELTALPNPDNIQEFCVRHTFQPSEGKSAAVNMVRLVADTPHETILHMIDSFRLHKILFFVGNIPVILGPFCPSFSPSAKRKSSWRRMAWRDSQLWNTFLI